MVNLALRQSLLELFQPRVRHLGTAETQVLQLLQLILQMQVGTQLVLQQRSQLFTIQQMLTVQRVDYV